METVMIALIVFGAAFLIGYGIVAWRKKRRADTIAKEHAEDQKNPMTAGMAYPVWTKREATNYPSAPTPSPTVIHQDSGMSPLMYGALGYMIGSSGNSHAAHPEPSTVNIGTCPAERDSDIGGGSSNYDSGSSSDSSSSDSSSSYDSGGSSDSGGGGGGGD